MTNDPAILERRIRQLHALPWPIPAAVVVQMSDEDLETVERFFGEFGGLPPTGYFRRLWWWIWGGG